MKKLLLTLLLLLSLGFAASAQNLTLGFKTGSNTGGTTAGKNTTVAQVFDEASVSFVSSLDTKTNVFPATANGVRVGATAGGKFVFTLSQTVKATKVIFTGKTYGGSNKTKLTKSQITFNNQAGEVHSYDSGASIDYEETFVLDGSELKQLTIQVSTGIFISKIEICEEEQSEPEAIELSEDNILIEDHNGQSLVGGASYEYEAGAKISFNYSYTGNVANPEINYSYSVNDGEAVEGNEYTYDGNGDVTLKMMVTSGENAVSKTITILKKYPTVCPDPVFSVANNADVTAGQVIKVSCEGAKNLTWTVNGTPIEGDSYTVTEEPGTQLNFEAKATIDGRLASGELGELSSTATLVVNVVEAPLVAEFDFSKFGWENAKEISTVKVGVVTLTFDKRSNNLPPKYYTSDNDVRLYGGGSLTISIDRAYYITKIESVYNNTKNNLTADCGSFNNDLTVWTNVKDGTECKKSSVTFSEDGTSGNRSWKSIVVTFAKRDIWVHFANVDITHGKVAGVVTIEYTFDIANHNGNTVDVTATINGKEYEFENVALPASAPARVDAENQLTNVSGKIKATHVDFKGATNLQVNVKATLDGNNELYNEVHAVTNTTGIEDVTVEGGEAAEYFNLQGIRVAEPQAGQVYIVRRGAKTTKELVK